MTRCRRRHGGAALAVGALAILVSGTVVSTDAQSVGRRRAHLAAADIYINTGAVAGEQSGLSKRVRSAVVTFFATTSGASPAFVKLAHSFDRHRGAFLTGESRFFTLAEQAGTSFINDGARPRFDKSVAAAETTWVKSAGSFDKARGTGTERTGLEKAEFRYFVGLVADANSLARGSTKLPAFRTKYDQITLNFGLTVDGAFSGWLNQASHPVRQRLLKAIGAANRAFYKSTVASEDRLLATLRAQPPSTTTTTTTSTTTATSTTTRTASTISVTCSNPAGPPWPGNSTVHVSGVISPPVSGAAVSLTYAPPSGSATTHAPHTDSSGGYQDSLTPTTGGTLASGHWTVTASWPGNNAYAGAQNSCGFTVS